MFPRAATGNPINMDSVLFSFMVFVPTGHHSASELRGLKVPPDVNSGSTFMYQLLLVKKKKLIKNNFECLCRVWKSLTTM